MHTPNLDLIEVIRQRDPEYDNITGTYHNVLGVVVFGERGWVPAGYMNAYKQGVPTITLEEVYIDGVPSTQRECTLSHRPWIVSPSGYLHPF